MKKRWPEVAIIIAIAIIPPRLFEMITRSILVKSDASHGIFYTAHYLRTALELVIAAILIVIKAGFFRTAYLHGTENRRVGALFGQGRRFFWRMVVFGIILRLIYVPTQMVISFIIAKCAAPDNYLIISWWTSTLCMTIISVALMKPVLLVPALIIVRDISLVDAVKSIREYKIFRAKELLILFGIQQGLNFVYLFLMPLRNAAFSQPLWFARGIIGYFLVVAIALSAVRFVAEKALPIESAEKNEPEPK